MSRSSDIFFGFFTPPATWIGGSRRARIGRRMSVGVSFKDYDARGSSDAKIFRSSTSAATFGRRFFSSETFIVPGSDPIKRG